MGTLRKPCTECGKLIPHYHEDMCGACTITVNMRTITGKTMTHVLTEREQEAFDVLHHYNEREHCQWARNAYYEPFGVNPRECGCVTCTGVLVSVLETYRNTDDAYPSMLFIWKGFLYMFTEDGWGYSCHEIVQCDDAWSALDYIKRTLKGETE